MDNIIEVKGLRKTFKNNEALKDVSFNIKKGEIFGFLGPSGSGKTTTIKILTGQLKHTDGSAKLFNESVESMKKQSARKRIGVLTDNSGLYTRLSIKDNLQLYCDLYGVPYKRIDEVLNIVNLFKDKEKKVSILSRGMMQRVTLARALLHEPDLLFLDEPTSALDPVNTLHIYNGLRALNEKGTTIFLTTHDMYEAETLCDRVAFLNKGEIQLLGTPSELRQQYSNKTLTVELINGEKHTLPLGEEGSGELHKYMQTNQVVTIHSNEPTLGDIFVKVTGRKLV